jgi:hypothetical protein
VDTPVKMSDQQSGEGDSDEVNVSALEHRLDVVICADVIGYSRLVGIQEDGTLARLHIRKELTL